MQKFVAKEQGKITKILSGKISYGVVMSALKKKDVKVNGKRVNKDLTVNVADVIEIYYTQKPTTPKYEKVFEDDNLLVVDKDGGITSEELFDILKEEYLTLRFIHRLDRNTTGIIIFAKIALFCKCFTNFFGKIHGLVHLILYFCALEILPDLMAWKGIEIVSNNLTLNI